MKKHKIIISGGGTGGHIFPALAIAKELEKKHKGIDFLFVGASNRMEMQKVPAYGYNIIGLWISGFQRKFTVRNLFFPLKLILSLFHSIYIIKKFNPDLVIGTGGYASGPILFVASKLKIPCIIQEQNSYPGITNRLLGNRVDKICVAYDNMQRYFPEEKIIVTGNPIRQNILNFDKKNCDVNDFKFKNKSITVLVVGGSLGAESINQVIEKNLKIFEQKKINIIWQTGKTYYDANVNFIKANKYKNLMVLDFVKNMSDAYSSADIIISRAGAIAISELCFIAKPLILVPSPNVAENHQYKNAQSLVNKNAALLVKDNEANCKLVNVLIELCDNKDLQIELKKNIKNLAISDASEKIATIALNLIKK
ncbi:MAG: undecaprenyldiphospho-muramoylpentapeptide beta-N-acetylglucosaminyltransferase [Flavobacteriales bacterium]|nr:undecaprenyldiphospho-muramoylpentapeptide beta-N-acetylglucosaminyltransferase [Flavobacteriales bacterium]|tara:strand:- start:6183 stop:7283 length:1101 start_codon:yes stop_codon:yes gene_type:complete